MTTKQPDTVIELELLAPIACIAEVFNADAAADEQLAGQMLQLGSGALMILEATTLAAELRSCPRTCFRI